MSQTAARQNRNARRAPVLLTATIHVSGSPTSVRLRNLSSQGALIEGDTLPEPGSVTRFLRNELDLKSTVVWVQGSFAGLVFDHPLEEKKVLRPIAAPAERVTKVVKRPGLACRPLTQRERDLMERWMTSSPIVELGE